MREINMEQIDSSWEIPPYLPLQNLSNLRNR